MSKRTSPIHYIYMLASQQSRHISMITELTGGLTRAIVLHIHKHTIFPYHIQHWLAVLIHFITITNLCVQQQEYEND